MLTELEKKIIASIQGDIPVTMRPYRGISQKLGISEETLLENLQRLCDQGFIRRFGATLRHQRTGYTANAMAAWLVEENRIDEVGNMMASFKQVSHCYRRNHRWMAIQFIHHDSCQRRNLPPNRPQDVSSCIS